MKFNYSWFKHNEYSKVVWYKNPNECSSFNVERVNPDHIGILWGRRKKGHKGRNWIQVAKIYFSIIPITYGLFVTSWLDAITGYVHGLLLNVGLLSIITYSIVSFIVYSPVLLQVKKCRMNGGQY